MRGRGYIARVADLGGDSPDPDEKLDLIITNIVPTLKDNTDPDLILKFRVRIQSKNSGSGSNFRAILDRNPTEIPDLDHIFLLL